RRTPNRPGRLLPRPADQGPRAAPARWLRHGKGEDLKIKEFGPRYMHVPKASRTARRDGEPANNDRCVALVVPQALDQRIVARRVPAARRQRAERGRNREALAEPRRPESRAPLPPPAGPRRATGLSLHLLRPARNQ